MNITSSWRDQKFAEEQFVPFFPQLNDPEMSWQVFMVRRSPRHHMLWQILIDGWKGEQSYTKGLSMTYADMERVLKDREAAAQVVKKLNSLPWTEIGLYEVTPDPPLFELSRNMCIAAVMRVERTPIEAWKLFTIAPEGHLAPAFISQYKDFRYEMGVLHEHPNFDPISAWYQNGYYAFKEKKTTMGLLENWQGWNITPGPFAILRVHLTGEVYRGRQAGGEAYLAQRIWIPKTTIVPIHLPDEARRYLMGEF